MMVDKRKAVLCCERCGFTQSRPLAHVMVPSRYVVGAKIYALCTNCSPTFATPFEVTRIEGEQPSPGESRP